MESLHSGGRRTGHQKSSLEFSAKLKLTYRSKTKQDRYITTYQQLQTMAAYFATFYQIIMSTCLIFMSTSLQLVA